MKLAKRCAVPSLLISAFLLLSAPQAMSQAEILELPLQGIKIEMNERGDWERIFATGIQPVEFPDRRGITTAQRIAQQRAQAEIVRFFSQDISAETIVNEMESTAQVATRQSGEAGESISRESQRVLSTSLNEVFRSFSSGTLRGVVVLAAGYDEASEEAWVEVGISRTSANMAAQTQDAMTNPSPQGVDATTAGSDVSQPGEIRRGPKLP